MLPPTACHLLPIALRCDICVQGAAPAGPQATGGSVEHAGARQLAKQLGRVHPTLALPGIKLTQDVKHYNARIIGTARVYSAQYGEQAHY